MGQKFFSYPLDDGLFFRPLPDKDIPMRAPLSLPLLFTIGAITLLSSPSFAAEPSHFLADRHVARGMKCADCHADNKSLKMVGDNQICVSCHGDYPDMVKKTDGRYEVNPHAQHDGLLPCTECHKGHTTSVNYCGQCHNYTYKVP